MTLLMKPTKCYAVPVVLYVMAENKRNAKELVKEAMKETSSVTIDLAYALGGDFVGIVGVSNTVLRGWDVDDLAKPEQFGKNFRKTWNPDRME
jgi:hypothetical protein